MDLSISELFTYIGTGIGSIAVYIFGKNEKLREGITSALLKKMNKTPIKKIPLMQHKVFWTFSQRMSNLTYFVMEDAVKIEFYKRYIKILFTELELACTDIVEHSKSEEIMTTLISQKLELAMNHITIKIHNELIIPDVIEKQFEQWLAMLRNSFVDVIEDILNDDLIDSNYFITYRLLDAISAYCKFVLNSGALEFQKMNGAFKNLTIKDILKDGNTK